MVINRNKLPNRWVVFDTETTGTLPTRDRIVSIGAVAIQDMEIVPEDSFECLVRIPYNSSAVVVHGITKEQTQREGIEEEEAIKLFSEYIGEACLVGHHVAFDVIAINHALQRIGRPTLENGAIDLMKLVLELEEKKIIQPRPNEKDFSLDGLLEKYHVGKSGRHTAMGDSFLTALVFMKLMGSVRRKNPELIQNTIEWDIGLGQEY